jgi:DNA-binding LytR/AlgR family response regulator
MQKKAERAKKIVKNKATSVTEELKLAETHFSDVSGLLSVTLNIENGAVSLVDWNFSEYKASGSGKALKKVAARVDNGVAPEAKVMVKETLNNTIFIRENKILQRLWLNDILYIQAMGDYVSIYTRDRKITIHQNLKALELKLPSPKFIRIHRSFMVSLDKIDAIEESTVYINSNPIPVGEAYKSKLMKLLSIIR